MLASEKYYLLMPYDSMLMTACLVVNPIKVNSFAYLFNCTTVGRTSVSEFFSQRIQIQSMGGVTGRGGGGVDRSDEQAQNQFASSTSSKLGA